MQARGRDRISSIAFQVQPWVSSEVGPVPDFDSTWKGKILVFSVPGNTFGCGREGAMARLQLSQGFKTAVTPVSVQDRESAPRAQPDIRLRIPVPPLPDLAGIGRCVFRAMLRARVFSDARTLPIAARTASAGRRV